ncbi:adenylate/guanylate cyclase domain-containing protein [Conexibacter woesei]|uniref:adenylate/guanylate cyclase domain-containing protein n=1 Tax=Conexibacter woesei TaxID=191495 RepID=UPI0004081270|nr:adenylate/guanylate cyclase domain-containing protein [Conexibacter woesei]
MDRLPLPEHPTLRAVAERLEERRHVAEVWDADWRFAYATTDYLVSCGTTTAAALRLVGLAYDAPEMTAERATWPGFATEESWATIAKHLRPMIEGTVRQESLTFDDGELKFGRRTLPFQVLTVRLLDDRGSLAGTVNVIVPGLSGAALSLLASGDHRSLERLLDTSRPARRRAALLFADLEGSSALARSLPAAEYFRLIRRLMSRADAAIVDRGGLVGRHAGDGLSALFLADQIGSESATARACIEAAQAIAAEQPDGLSVRFGLHWAATPFVGNLLTSGRTEVTALGDEMNEAARIEACAAGGRLLASKALIERLESGDAAALRIDPAALRFTPLGELPGAPEKARRDAPSLAVCDLTAPR